MTPARSIPLIHQLKRTSRDDADATLAELIDEVESYLPAESPAGLPITPPMASLDLHTPLGDVSLFTIIATPRCARRGHRRKPRDRDFLPADADSAARLRELAELREQVAAVGSG